MTTTFPCLTSYDPPGTSESSLDPLHLTGEPLIPLS